MAQDPKASDGVVREKTWLNLLQRVGEALVPAALTAGGLLGFVAFAGSVIVWTRFSAAQVPPDQVVAAYPRGELVAIASALLLLFGFVGLLAVVSFYLISPKAEATVGMNRGLLILLAVEGLVAIILAEATSWQHTAVACELFLLPTLMAFWATFIYENLKVKNGKRPGSSDDKAGGIADWVGDDLKAWTGADLRAIRLRSFVSIVTTTVCFVGFVALVLVFIVGLPGLTVAVGGLALIGIVPTLALWRLWVQEDDGTEAEERKKEKRNDDEASVPFTRTGVAVILLLAMFAAVGPSLVLTKAWLFFSLIAAVVLMAGLWRVAVMVKGRFAWYGLAVFISVPLFGTLTGMARNIDDPQVQPMALIRKTDGPDEAIQGLYVTETDSRIYFATVATEGCSKDLVPHSGRLLWVPKSEVVAMSVGPLQNVDSAAKTALEMSYALTPAVETPAGDHVSLTVGEKRTKAKLGEAEASPQGRRLESTGAAVQPNFGTGLRLDPENASPGEVVTLRMSSPNRNSDVRGFGRNREHRTLRLGGVPVDILKEEARSPWDGEYVETSGGKTLKITKHALYAERNGEYVELKENAPITGPVFVKLNDSSVVESDDQGMTSEDGYLRLEEGDGEPAQLAVARVYPSRAAELPPEVILRDGRKEALKPRLLRQAWHEDHIKFIVPENATTGPVTVECEQLSGQPLLRVAQPPVARIAVRMVPGSRRVVFDSQASTDENGKIVSRRWTIDGLRGGYGKRIAQRLPPRLEDYAVRLTVTDSEGQVGTAEFHMLRLPASLTAFHNGKAEHPRVIQHARASLRSAAVAEPSTQIEFDGHAGAAASSLSPDRELEGIETIRNSLMNSKSLDPPILPTSSPALTVRTLAYGAECRPEAGEDGEARVDILVLGQGVQMVSSPRCPPDRVQTAHGWPSTPP